MLPIYWAGIAFGVYLAVAAARAGSGTAALPLAAQRARLLDVVRKTRAFLLDETARTGGKTTMRRAIIIVNPVGGSQGGMAVVCDVLVPRLAIGGVIADRVLVTEESGHARRLALEASFDDVDVLIVVGGDGHLQEVVDGVLAREDAARVLRNVGIAVVPAGTGNGVAKSLGMTSADDVVDAIVADTHRGLDVFRMRTRVPGKSEPEVRYGCLSVTWGLIADSDYRSEVTYRWMGQIRLMLAAIITVLEFKAHVGKLTFTRHGSDEEETIEDCFRLFLAGNTTHIAHDVLSTPDCAVDDGSMDLLLIRGGGRAVILSFFLFASATSRRHMDHPLVDVIKVSKWRLEPTGDGHVCLDGNNVPVGTIDVEPGQTQWRRAFVGA